MDKRGVHTSATEYGELVMNCIIQVICPHFKGMGVVTNYTTNCIVLEPHSDKVLEEEYGESITHKVIVPFTEISVTIILKDNI
ncbi:MAG: hypothetical protein H8E12_02550 [Rhodobacteraceae bacterium]|nr:hypothetical protein [Paracoccaceae bacterium]